MQRLPALICLRADARARTQQLLRHGAMAIAYREMQRPPANLGWRVDVGPATDQHYGGLEMIFASSVVQRSHAILVLCEHSTGAARAGECWSSLRTERAHLVSATARSRSQTLPNNNG